MRAVTVMSSNGYIGCSMTISGHIAAGFACAALFLHYATAGIAISRCRKKAANEQAKRRPAFSLVRPLRGVETYSRETLASSFVIDYPEYEVLFCIADPNDPVAPLVRELIAAHPQRDAQLLAGEEAFSANPKLNNMVKGFRAARHSHVVFADSNVLLPADYLDRLALRIEAGAGLVTAPPVGYLPQGILGRCRMRFPQYIPGARSICGRYARLRLCTGQDAVLPPRRSRTRRPRTARGRTGGRRRGDKAHARERQEHQARRPVRAIDRPAHMGADVVPAGALGAPCAVRVFRCCSHRKFSPGSSRHCWRHRLPPLCSISICPLLLSASLPSGTRRKSRSPGWRAGRCRCERWPYATHCCPPSTQAHGSAAASNGTDKR